MNSNIEIIADGWQSASLAAALGRAVPTAEFRTASTEVKRGVWTDPAVVSALISGGSTVLAALIGALALLYVERRKKESSDDRPPVIIITHRDGQTEQRLDPAVVAELSTDELEQQLTIPAEAVDRVLMLADE